jgi:hypothetical protein
VTAPIGGPKKPLVGEDTLREAISTLPDEAVEDVEVTATARWGSLGLQFRGSCGAPPFPARAKHDLGRCPLCSQPGGAPARYGPGGKEGVGLGLLSGADGGRGGLLLGRPNWRRACLVPQLRRCSGGMVEGVRVEGCGGTCHRAEGKTYQACNVLLLGRWLPELLRSGLCGLLGQDCQCAVLA